MIKITRVTLLILVAFFLIGDGVEGDLVTKFDALTKRFKEDFEQLVQKERRKIQDEVHKLVLVKKQRVNISDDDIIHLNIAGEMMVTKRSTLRQVNGSRLANMFSKQQDSNLERDKNGNVFFDLDPRQFRLILNYLRARKIETKKNPATLPKIAAEESQNFNNLIAHLRLQKIFNPSPSPSPTPSRMARPVKDSFQRHSSGITIQDNGAVAVHRSSSGHKYVLGRNSYQKGVKRWRLKLEHFKYNHWMLIGILKANVVPSNDYSYSSTGSYSWSLGNNYQVYTNGKVSKDAALRKANKQGDIVQLVLDCDVGRLTLILPSGKRFQHSFPNASAWRLHVNLWGSNDRVRIL